MNTEGLGDEHRAEKDHEVHRQHGWTSFTHKGHISGCTTCTSRVVFVLFGFVVVVCFFCCLLVVFFFFFFNVSPSLKEKSKSTFALSAQQNELPHREKTRLKIFIICLNSIKKIPDYCRAFGDQDFDHKNALKW